jgi:pyruvate/2-oxoglutarate dehydrogenase complex dihydrolipoamide dehydrogenase (E3) component
MKNLQEKYDLVVLGAGPAGTPVACKADDGYNNA